MDLNNIKNITNAFNDTPVVINNIYSGANVLNGFTNVTVSSSFNSLSYSSLNAKSGHIFTNAFNKAKTIDLSSYNSGDIGFVNSMIDLESINLKIKRK